PRGNRHPRLWCPRCLGRPGRQRRARAERAAQCARRVRGTRFPHRTDQDLRRRGLASLSALWQRAIAWFRVRPGPSAARVPQAVLPDSGRIAVGAQYRAFLSYSHRDAKWANWLHKALETYRPPKGLIGTVTPVGPVPRRLIPIFQDRQELASATELG